jgi:DNA recombination protein RmuC
MRKLSDKRYWAQFEGSPEFVVMFVPGDQFVDAALARRPDLIERAAEANVILASPSTLIGLLRAVAVGWREHRLAESAGELFDLGRELHERAQKVFERAARVGDSLQRAVQSYNAMVGSIDARLVPTLRRFEDAGASGAKPVDQLALIDIAPRELQAAQEDDE